MATTVVRAILGPLARMEAMAVSVVADGLPPQVTGAHDGSLSGGLWRSLNRMLSELEDARLATDAAGKSRAGMRGVLVQACMQLRRPVSVVRGAGEFHRLRGTLTVREIDRMLSRVADEAACMGAIVDDLADSGRDHPRPTPGSPRTG
ncbi:MAG TPA: hypothetical protein VEL03_09195 [Streptosporangiaceae bacterium]|nr:hypothetical protein [Streptosporangiaceae bacterium]